MFGGKETNYGIQAYENLNYLFQYNEATGYYTYDSAQNFATIYDSNGNRAEKNGEDSFLVYDGPNDGTSSGSTGHPYFLPFNQPGTNESGADYHFGMKMTINDFLMPKDGKIGDENMTFSFAGDDDVWVYIDGVLILDMGGIHNSNTGNINFGTGIVTVDRVSYKDSQWDRNASSQTAYIGDLLYEAKKNDQVWINANLVQKEESDGRQHWFIKDYTTHDLSFFYLERGAVDSNCKIEFNLYTLQQNAIYVGKQLESDEETTEDISNYLKNIEYKFRILDTDTNDLFIQPGTEYEVYEIGGEFVEKGTVGDNGIFTVKADQYAVFSNISEDRGSYYVQELMDEDYSAQFGDVEVSVKPEGGESGFQESDGVIFDGVQFDGAISGAMDASNHIGYVMFRNKVDTTKLSSLSIEKHVLPGSDIGENEEFVVYLTMGGEPVPINTTYQLYTGESDNAQTMSVTEAGKITLKAGQRAVFTVLTGTEFTIYEENGDTYHANFEATQQFDDGSEYQYKLTQSNTENDGVCISGIVGDLHNTEFGDNQKPDDGTNASMLVTLSNSTFDFSASFEVKKTLKGWTSGNYTFNFNVVQTNEHGENLDTVTDGIKVISPVTIEVKNEDASSGFAYINFEDRVENGTYYFKVSESGNNPYTGVQYDTNYYIVQVTVSDTNGAKAATVESIVKYNSAGESIGSDCESAAFINSLSSKLTVTKVVDGEMGDTTKQFDFTLSLKLNGTPYSEATLSVTKFSSAEDQTGETYDIQKNDTGLYEFTLGHEQRIEIEVPYGYEATVTETTNEGYTVSTRTDNEGVFEVNTQKSETVITNDVHQVDFKNYRPVVAPTGLESNHTTPYGLMVGAAGVAGAALVGSVVVRRRRRRQE